MTTRKHDEPEMPTSEDVGRIIAMVPTTDANTTTRAAFELLLAYEAYRAELCNEASFMPEEKIVRDEAGAIIEGASVQSGALDALWERVEAARKKLVESAR